MSYMRGPVLIAETVCSKDDPPQHPGCVIGVKNFLDCIKLIRADFEQNTALHQAADFQTAQEWLQKDCLHALVLGDSFRYEEPVPFDAQGRKILKFKPNLKLKHNQDSDQQRTLLGQPSSQATAATDSVARFVCVCYDWWF